MYKLLRACQPRWLLLLLLLASRVVAQQRRLEQHCVAVRHDQPDAQLPNMELIDGVHARHGQLERRQQAACTMGVAQLWRVQAKLQRARTS